MPDDTLSISFEDRIQTESVWFQSPKPNVLLLLFSQDNNKKYDDREAL